MAVGMAAMVNVAKCLLAASPLARPLKFHPDATTYERQPCPILTGQ
jgi:hypothetical protein